jgi:hypothetical protein
MAKLIRYKASRPGMSELANAPFVDDMLFDRASNVADVARAVYEANPPREGEFEVEAIQDDSDSDRARVAVIARHPAALAYEAHHRVLGSAISAAGGLNIGKKKKRRG